MEPFNSYTVNLLVDTRLREKVPLSSGLWRLELIRMKKLKIRSKELILNKLLERVLDSQFLLEN
jgi:hypothetical protein